MRAFTAVVLAALLFLNLFGVYALFLVRQNDVQKQMEVLVRSNSRSRQRISLHSSEFAQLRWKKAGKEIEFQGKLYDVASIERSGDQYHLYVVEDSVEKALIADFVKLHRAKPSDHDNNPVKSLLQVLLLEFDSMPAQQVFIIQDDVRGSISLDEFSHSRSLAVGSPPPDFT